MALDPGVRERLQARSDEIVRATVGEGAFAALERRRLLDRVCYRCPYRSVDAEGKLEPCDPPAEHRCPRAAEEDVLNN